MFDATPKDTSSVQSASLGSLTSGTSSACSVGCGRARQNEKKLEKKENYAIWQLNRDASSHAICIEFFDQLPQTPHRSVLGFWVRTGREQAPAASCVQPCGTALCWRMLSRSSPIIRQRVMRVVWGFVAWVAATTIAASGLQPREKKMLKLTFDRKETLRPINI